MSGKKIGISFQRPTARETLDSIVRAEELGVPAIWLTMGGAGDPMTVFAAAAPLTKNIRMGTAIVPTFPRHPVVLAQQAQVIAGLAPGRLTVGVGPSHEPLITRIYGLPFERPLEHLREYVAILRGLFENGKMDFEGRRFKVQAQLPAAMPMPIMISALRRNSFKLAGEIADGAISWICPAPYLRDVALPALREGAAAAGRAVPPLVAHAFIAVSENADEAMQEARRRVGIYPRMPFYAQMLINAGYPEAEQGEWSDRMLEAVVIHGAERDVAQGLRSFLSTSGAGELIASIIPVGKDQGASVERALALVGGL